MQTYSANSKTDIEAFFVSKEKRKKRIKNKDKNSFNGLILLNSIKAIISKTTDEKMYISWVKENVPIYCKYFENDNCKHCAIAKIDKKTETMFFFLLSDKKSSETPYGLLHSFFITSVLFI